MPLIYIFHPVKPYFENEGFLNWAIPYIDWFQHIDLYDIHCRIKKYSRVETDWFLYI